MFRFKQAQRTDYAQGALHDGIILAHGTGCGKSIAGLTWPLIKVGFEKRNGGIEPTGRVLYVVPEHLHAQWEEEGHARMRTKFIKLDCQATYLRLKAQNGGVLPHGRYLTSFTQLAVNKVAHLPDLSKPMTDAELRDVAKQLRVTLADVEAEPTVEWVGDHSYQLSPGQRLIRACGKKLAVYSEGLGEGVTYYSKVNGQESKSEAIHIRCIYSPSLAELCRNDFECVVIDEAVKIKGDYTHIGVGCRLMNPRYRLVLTATPIKNRLPDLFWLAWWAAGGREEAHPRWPYSSEPGEKEKFAEEFLVCERNLTKEREANNGKILSPVKRGGQERRGKVTAEVCNVHRLWKLIAPVVLRRRKQDFGEEIVKKIRQPIRVPMGTHQAAVYKYHLEANYLDKNGKPALGAKLTALRIAAVAPHSPSLTYVSRDPRLLMTMPQPEFGGGSYYRSKHDYTPKVAAAMSVIEQRIRAGKQIVVFSSFIEPLDTIGRRLTDAGIPFETMDGRSSSKVRGGRSMAFKKGRPHGVPVLLACRPAVAEGNSWNLCQSGMHLDYDWALDLNIQSDDRYHRMNSPEDVDSYRLMAKGSIDRKLESLFEEKDDSAELVLDGTLLEEVSEEVNIFKVLQIAEREFSAEETINEEELEASWPELRALLQDAWKVTSVNKSDEKHTQVNIQELNQNVETDQNLNQPQKIHVNAGARLVRTGVRVIDLSNQPAPRQPVRVFVPPPPRNSVFAFV